MTANKEFLKPILESSEGIHLTAYIENKGQPEELKLEVAWALQRFERILRPVMEDDEREKILQPIKNMLKSPELLRGFRSNLGIFRNQDSFRVIGIPANVRNMSVVATTFHVKPLLVWQQNKSEYYFLGAEADRCTLYKLGYSNELKAIETVLYPATSTIYPQTGGGNFAFRKRIRNAAKDIVALTKSHVGTGLDATNLPIFIAGDSDLTREVVSRSRRTTTPVTPIHDYFLPEELSRYQYNCTKYLKRNNQQKLRETIHDMVVGSPPGVLKKDIFSILNEALRGNIRRLVISDKTEIFGKICGKTGKLTLHPTHQDHEDDDILDDIAQKVLKSGGEVLIAPKEEMPVNKIAMAVTKTKVLPPGARTVHYQHPPLKPETAQAV